MINGLIPQISDQLELVIADMRKQGYAMRVTGTTRTWAQQNAIYAQGRTAPGKKVTDARGGESWHNYQVAADLCFEGTDPWADKNPNLWNIFGATAKKYGFEWGGDWRGGSFGNVGDRPHVQMAFGYDVFKLKAMGEAKALEILRKLAAEKYPSQPTQKVSSWAEPSFQKAEQIGFSRDRPQDPVDPVRLRKFLVKMGYEIKDSDAPVTYEELLHTFGKRGDIDRAISEKK